MFILILILIISIINTVINIVLLYLIIRNNGNVLANKIGNQNKNKGIILNIQQITYSPHNAYNNREIIEDMKYNANKSEPSNYGELNN